MSKKQKMIRLMISGTLLLAVAFVGVSVYQVDQSQQERMEELNEAANEKDGTSNEEEHLIQGGNSTAGQDDLQPHYSVIEDEEEEVPEAENASSGDVTAQMDIKKEEEKTEETMKAQSTEEKETEGTTETAADAGSAAIVPEIDFSGELLMNWPVEGTILMDYSMDHSIYFETLNVYKYNPSVVLSAEVGIPVEAADHMKILKIEENLETGTTLTASLGNGYEVVYGQLKDVKVAVDDVVTAGTVLGYVGEPTKYYAKEGGNLYFAMTKDGESIDPVLYLP